MLASLLSLLALVPAAPSTAETMDTASFGRCERLAERQPESEETSLCFRKTGEALQRTEAAATRLRELLQRHPGSPWPTLYLAFQDTEHAEELSRAAAAGFISRHDVKGEVVARANLYRLLYGKGRLEEAGAQAQRAVRVAEASGQPEMIARASVLQARHLWGLGKDLEQAYLMLRRAETVLFLGASYSIKKDCLSALGNLSLELGRYREGLDAFRRMTELAAAEGDRFAEANARYGMVRAVLEANNELPGEVDPNEAPRLAREALAAAIAGKHRGIESKAHYVLGILSHDTNEARQHFDACLAAADSGRDRSYCLNGLARHLAPADPRGAEKAIDESLALAHQAQDYWSMAFAWEERMRVSWVTDPVDRAFEHSQSTLEVIEALRDLQAAASGKAEAFSAWSEDYYWLSGHLIEAARAGGGPKDLERGFGVAERMRARTLISTLEAARALPAAAAPFRQQRGAVLERISSVQRQLMDPDLPAEERAAGNRELERLEIEEADLRNQLARAAPVLAAARRPDFATLARVRKALGSDEALLSFQIAPWEDQRGGFAGGSWLLVVSRAGTRVYRLPGRAELRSAVRLFTGMFDRRDGAEAGPAAALYRQLLERPLQELPAGVRRLILIPDDALHQLPFAALRSSAQAPPLAVRFEMTQVPSATLWLSWVRRRPARAPIPALAVGDPPLPGERPQPAAARERGAVFASGIRLGALPFARREIQAAVQSLGGGSERRLGEDASEAFVKSAALNRFGILHFATHAVTDEAHPERSGVLLAPGAANQDGLLQIREIVDLDLKGRVVVLSACSTNTGALLRGEGVMSLARAFFQAGAHTVVASLWRLRDDEAADLFERFYRHLGRGASVAAALQGAQRDAIADGAPAAAWAGLVVLGDGGLVPLPGGRKGLDVPLWAWGLAVLVLLLGGGVFWRRNRDTSRTSN